MKGLELAERFYFECGAPMLREKFPEIEKYIAAGLCGSGSECFGYDDELSADHDFEPGFCLFIPDEDIVDSRCAFALERAYSALPKVFMGYRRSSVSPVGGQRHGVIRISDFLTAKTGDKEGNLTDSDWFFLPEQSLAEATNGRIFSDPSGHFTSVREKLSYLPENVRLKKLAGNLLVMGQSGQYNYPRCLLRKDTAAAQLCVTEFVNSTLRAIFLLNKKYIPYYKWTFRALKELPRLSDLSSSLEYLISSGNGEKEGIKKKALIEDICCSVAKVLKADGITIYSGDEAEGHAYSVNDRITDSNLRNLHILYGV